MSTHVLDARVARASGDSLAPATHRWAARFLSGVPVLFLAVDGMTKIVVAPPVVVALKELGYPVGVARGLGLLLLTCLALYVWPRTAVLGAVLLTGYLGGAVATHVRLSHPWFSHVLFPLYLGLPLWAGLYLRDARLRALFPWRSHA